MGKIKKILEQDLVGGIDNTDVYPVTSTKAVYNENSEQLDDILTGLNNRIDDVNQSLTLSRSEGYNSIIPINDDTNKAYGKSSTVLGHGNTAGNVDKIITDPEDPVRGDEDAGYGALATGLSSIAKGRASHSEGEGCTAEGAQSHAEGNHTTASGKVSHAEGSYTTASGEHSHAEGNSCIASGNRSHAEGDNTKANGDNSHSEGFKTIANNRAELAIGHFNKSNKANDTYGDAGNTTFSIGIGTSDSERKNAVEVMQNGDVYVKGIGDYDGKNLQIGSVKSLQSVLSNTVDSNYVDNRLEQLETDAREYADAAVAGHIVIFDGTNSFAEIKDAIQRDIPIIARFPAGTNIGGITIDTAQMAAATTKMDDVDIISLRFVFCEGYSFFQAIYEAVESVETWLATSDYLATRDDLASKPDIFILSEDSTLEEAINAINQKMFIAIWSNHPDTSGGYLFADYVDILSDGLPLFCFHYIKNRTVNEVVYQYINTDEYNVGWAISDSEYTIPLSGNLVTLNSEQTITAKKTFSAGINLNGTTISKVGSPVNTDDAANKQYVDDATGNIVNIEANVEALQYNVDEIYGRLEQYQLGIAYDDYQSFLNAARYIIDDWPVGQNIYIRQLDVPDLWVSKVFRNVDDVREYTYTTDEQFIQDVRNGVQIWHHQFSLLETAKVDLSNTASKTEVTTLQAEVAALKAIINEITTKE